ncbi:hypothetical protein DRO35_00660 [Candidatus Bathyarchaeota archaeon]|nr:MAG: hypothetical protein DRO35_00660 [Candidatus Bathyarchaeota archaeon]
MKTMKKRRGTLLDAISDIFVGKTPIFKPPLGVEEIEKIDSDIVRIQFVDDIDCDLLCKEAIKEGYTVKRGWFTPRIIWDGTIIARVGGESDMTGQRSVFTYLIPPNEKEMSTYRRIVAIQHEVLDQRTNRINSEKFLWYNLRVIKLLENYRKTKYERLRERLEYR